MRRCQNCGAFLEEDSRFCTVCGTPVQIQQNLQNTKKDKKKKEHKEKEDSKNGLLPVFIVGGVFIVCVIVCITAFFLFGGDINFGSGKDSDKSRTKTEEREEREDREEREKQDAVKKESDTVELMTPTPTPEKVRPENVSISFCEAAPNLGNYYKLNIAASGATSYLVQDGVDHPNTADMVVDGNEISSWQEGVSGDGIGEAIWFDFPQEQHVKYLSFKLGNWRDLNNWTGNNRPARISITIGDYQCAVSFPDEQREFWIALSEPYPASQIRFQIDSVHQGAKWDDTCIAEIGIYGE